MSSIPTLKLAVCIFNGVVNSDYVSPLDMLSFLSPDAAKTGLVQPPPPVFVEPTYFAYSREPFRGSFVGPLYVPDRAYNEVGDGEQFDIILVPGGFGTRPEVIQPSLLEFLKKQVPGAKFVLSTCTGSWALAQAGVLNGKRATSNKALFEEIKETTKGNAIDWVVTDGWIIDDKFWSVSGSVAALGMMDAFLRHLAGDGVADKIKEYDA